jgi:Fe-S-cluster-containing dehydrogenase component
MFGIRLFEEMCVGCRSCAVACQAVRGLSAETTPLVINISEEVSEAGDLKLRFAAEACRHCSDAPCAEACPVEAIVVEASGTVVLSEKECTACGACIEACPYEAIYLDQEREAAVKCDLCSARTIRGLKPACVAACPGKAIYAGELKEIETAIDKRRKAFIALA